MHVLVIPSFYPEYHGHYLGSFFREQALALYKQGNKVGVIYPQLRSVRNLRSIFIGPYGFRYENDEGLLSCRYHSMAWFPSMPAANSRLWVKYGMWLYGRYVKEFGVPDIIHAHCAISAGILARSIYLTHGIPFVLTEHSTLFARGLINEQQKRLAEQVVLSAKKNYAVSPPFARILDDFFGKGKYTWEVMPNMVNRQFLECPLPTKSGTQPFCFLNVATLDTKKRQENLIAAFATEFRNDDSVQLVIAGDGPERQNLQELAQRSGVSDRIHFLGKLTRMGVLNAMSHASAFVLSSRYETFGVVLIESLALGVPVIATRCGGPESIVQEGDGVLVPVDDVPALAAAMRQLYQSHEEYDAEGIRERCRARFSEQVVSSMLMDRYNRVLSDHRPDARRGAT